MERSGENIEIESQRIKRMGNTEKNAKDWRINAELHEIFSIY